MGDNDLPAVTTASPEKAIEISPELLREIADKVYWLLVERLKIERERDCLAGDRQDMWRY